MLPSTRAVWLPMSVLPVVLAVSACGSQPRVAAVAPIPEAGASPPTAWDFEADPVGQPPTAFTLHSHGPGRPALWVVQTVSDAPSGGQVLAQTDDDPTNFRFNLGLSPASAIADVRVSVRGEAVSGKRDRSFGVVARWQEGDSYYLARCNTSGWGSNVRLYRFLKGEREKLAETEVAADAGKWYTIELEVRGDRLMAIFDGQQILSVSDTAITGPGRCGVWTKAESVSRFDDLLVTPLGTTP